MTREEMRDKDLLATIQCLQKEPAGPDAEKVMVAQEAYRELLDGFYEEYQDMMAPRQYELARDVFNDICSMLSNRGI